MPPFLAGRTKEKAEFARLLEQDVILENLVLTGLRGVGKTVLLETLKPIAVDQDWLWVGNDLTEASGISEASFATRVITDIAVVTSTIIVGSRPKRVVGLTHPRAIQSEMETLDFNRLIEIWSGTPGLASDKLKAVLEAAWESIKPLRKQGVVFAYDEAQNLSDHASKDEYPLSLLLDVFQSLQRKGIPFLLVLAGLPTLFPKLVEARTFAERMFHVVVLDRLNKEDSAEAVTKPAEDEQCPIKFSPASVDLIYRITRGYPYFIQYVCREVYDVWVSHTGKGPLPAIPVDDIVRKLDADFFAGRWSRVTERQRDLLVLTASLPTAGDEFSVQEIVEASNRSGTKPFSKSHVSQMLSTLSELGLVYRNRWGRYSFAVPLLDEFIKRNIRSR